MTRDTYTGENDEPRSLHLYTYCYCDPVNYTDLTGNKPAEPRKLIAPKSKQKSSKNNKISLPKPGPAPKDTRIIKPIIVSRYYFNCYSYAVGNYKIWMYPGHVYVDNKKIINKRTEMPVTYTVQNLRDWVLHDILMKV